MHSLVHKGLFHVVYAAEPDMKPDQQSALLHSIEGELKHGPVAIVFSVKQASGVDKAVPAFWLDVSKRLAPKLCAMAIASPSMVVRTAAAGFSVANKLRHVDLAVHAFSDEEEAVRWADTQLSANLKVAR